MASTWYDAAHFCYGAKDVADFYGLVWSLLKKETCLKFEKEKQKGKGKENCKKKKEEQE